MEKILGPRNPRKNTEKLTRRQHAFPVFSWIPWQESLWVFRPVTRYYHVEGLLISIGNIESFLDFTQCIQQVPEWPPHLSSKVRNH